MGQSHIDVPPGDTSTTHRSPSELQRFCIDWQSRAEKRARNPNPNPNPIPSWREYERHKYRSPWPETFATEQQPDSRTTRQKDGGEEDVDWEQGDGEGRQHRHRPRIRPQPDRQAPPQCQEDADAFGGKTERKRKKPSERGERRV